MIQDRAQKASALQYVVAKHWFPQLELDVYPSISIGATRRALTDVDVYALIPDEFDGFRGVLFDCKTRKSESPISRAIWQRGLMDILRAQRGICILKREHVEQDHRYTAAQFGVLLLTEDDFVEYVRSSAGPFESTDSNLADIELWDTFFSIPQRFPNLTPAIQFSRSGYWSSRTDSEACRRAIVHAIRLRPELDPSKSTHLAVIVDLAALFMHAVGIIVTQVFAGYLKPERRDELAEALLMLLYGGKEAYDVRSQLRRLATGKDLDGSDGAGLRLPEWDRFIQLVRHCLDAPVAVLQVPLILREVAWSFIGNKQSSFSRLLASKSPQAAKLAIIGTEYLCRAAGLPPEFNEIVGAELLAIQTVPS